MNIPAKFLVLLDAAQRALLFDSQRQLIGEVIEDDGFIVDGLLRSAIACPHATDSMMNMVMPLPSPDHTASCFELH